MARLVHIKNIHWPGEDLKSKDWVEIDDAMSKNPDTVTILFANYMETRDPTRLWNQNEDPPYNLSDMVKKPGLAKKRKQAYLNNFPDSICTEYIKTTSEKSNLEVLKKIVLARKDRHRPFPSTAVHLRTGDVIDYSPYSVKSLLSKPHKYFNGVYYVKPLSYYEDLVQKLDSRNPITLFSGFHHKRHEDHSKSLEYIFNIRNFFESRGFVVENVAVDNDPDEDFIKMIFADTFIESGGGFSDIIHKLRNKIRQDS